MNQRDLALEYLQHLDFDSIKNLCRSNLFYRQFCQTSQAQQIVRNKYIEEKELPLLINNINLKNTNYIISDIHSVDIERYSQDKFNLSEFIGESDYFDLNDMTSYQEPTPGLTPLELNELSQQSILLKLFPDHVKVSSGLYSRNIIYEIMITSDFSQSLSNTNIYHLLNLVLTGIFKTGIPIIKRKFITFNRLRFNAPTLISLPSFRK